MASLLKSWVLLNQPEQDKSKQKRHLPAVTLFVYPRVICQRQGMDFHLLPPVENVYTGESSQQSL